MAKQTIQGTVVYENLEGGIWGIVDDEGKKYQPVEMPEQLKYPGKKVEVKIKPLDDMMGFAMWGSPVKIIRFGTLMP